MNNINFQFDNPLFLLLLIPAIILTVFPYFRLPKRYRATRNRIVSMILHVIIMVLIVLVVSGFKVESEEYAIKDEVILVVDQSKSNTQFEASMNQFIESIIEEVPDGYYVGMVSFGHGYLYNVPLTLDKNHVLNQFQNQNTFPDATGTDIAGALRFAHASFSSPNRGRIILFTDGRETDGNALAAARSIANSGTRIDVHYTYSSTALMSEFQIQTVEIPQFIGYGETFPIQVKVLSTRATDAVIKLYDNDDPIGNPDGYLVSLTGGEDQFSFDHVLSTYLLHEIRVEIEPLEVMDDVILENNVYYSFVHLEGGMQRVLILDGTGDESNLLAPLLSEQFEVDVMNISSLIEGDYTFIHNYHLVITMNVANYDLPTGFDSALYTYVHDYGGSLYTVGGHKAYNRPDMEGTLFESMLPVDAITDQRPLALMLVIDASGSMVEGGSQKLNMAKLGAIESVNALGEYDFIGVITFNSSAHNIHPLTSTENKDEVITAIQGISNGTGTMYVPGIIAAKNALDHPNYQNFNKHIIFLTDGHHNDPREQINNTIDSLGDISLSTIALYDGGNSHGVDIEFIESMVRIVEGRGNFYEVSSANQLPSIMQQEALSVSTQYLNQETFEPTIQDRIYAVSPLIDMPQLHGYYGASIKVDADVTVVLTKESNPIYAEWAFGSGKVASFMSDLSGLFSSDFYTDERGIIFIKNTVHSMMAKLEEPNFNILVQFTPTNYQTTVHLTSDLSETDYMIASLIDPDGNVSNLLLTRQSLLTFGGTFTTEIPGIYTLNVRKLSSSGEILSETTAFTAFSYSIEYDAFQNDLVAFSNMQELAQIGNGSMLYLTSADLFSIEAQVIIHHIDLTLPFIITAMILFLLDIISRKFKFKWPHEWFKKKAFEIT